MYVSNISEAGACLVVGTKAAYLMLHCDELPVMPPFDDDAL